MIELRNDQLEFSFPEVHKEACGSISLIRTLRIPDDNQSYPLPPGFDRFPLQHVDDHLRNLPPKWERHGGVFLPMYQAEALWIDFGGDYPLAIQVAAGKVDALTGEAFRTDLVEKPQNYLVVPDQPWLDGFCVREGLIRQFVAMPLGEGYTAEEQITGEAQHGGLQFIVHPMKATRYREIEAERERMLELEDASAVYSAPTEMGLAPGGLMHQEVYADEYGIDAWEFGVSSRCFVHILNSAQYFAVTGSAPPHRPPTAEQYSRAGLPWFDYYDADRQALEGAEKLAQLDSVAVKQAKQGTVSPGNSGSPAPGNVIQLGPEGRQVREGLI